MQFANFLLCEGADELLGNGEIGRIFLSMMLCKALKTLIKIRLT